MKVVILAGGFGPRLSEYTKTIPKPMININGKPMLLHIMKFYAKHGFKNFYIALGYKGEMIKKFFKNNKNPSLLHPGMYVKFRSISKKEFLELESII